VAEADEETWHYDWTWLTHMTADKAVWFAWSGFLGDSCQQGRGSGLERQSLQVIMPQLSANGL